MPADFKWLSLAVGVLLLAFGGPTFYSMISEYGAGSLTEGLIGAAWILVLTGAVLMIAIAFVKAAIVKWACWAVATALLLLSGWDVIQVEMFGSDSSMFGHGPIFLGWIIMGVAAVILIKDARLNFSEDAGD